MIKYVVAVLFALSIPFAAADAPQPGLWWSPSESGRGYAIDSQGGVLVLTAFAYDYDHRDYSKPLEVDPVCRRCNQMRGPADYTWMRQAA